MLTDLKGRPCSMTKKRRSRLPLCVFLRGTDALVAIEDGGGGAEHFDLAVLKPERQLAKLAYHGGVMRHANQSLAGAFETLYLLDTLGLELLVADCKDLIDKQDVGIHPHRHGKRQPQHHPA